MGVVCVPLRRYGGTAGGTTIPPLYPQEVRRYHLCTLRRYDGTTPVPSGGTMVPSLYLEVVRLLNSCLFYTEITPGKTTVVPRAGTRVVPLYLVQVQGWYRCTSCRYRGKRQFSCKFRADATPNRSSFALPNPRGILLGHAHHMTATQYCQYPLFHEFQ